jgi:hypothetical protein
VATIEEASTGQTFSEIAHDIALQNLLIQRFPKFLHHIENCLALRNFNQFLHYFSSFRALFRRFHSQNLILMRNKHDIRNQHKKLH